jgi:hypothetical protein
MALDNGYDALSRTRKHSKGTSLLSKRPFRYSNASNVYIRMPTILDRI